MNKKMKMPVMIFTYGEAKDNNSNWSAIIVKTNKTIELKSSFDFGSPQRMELYALCESLKHINNESFDVYITTSSEYLYNTLTKGWLQSWRKNGWIKKDGKPVANKELWNAVYKMIQKHTINVTLEQNFDNSKQLRDCAKLVGSALPTTKTKSNSGFTNNLNNQNPITITGNVIAIYTDGACKGNPGPGGWAYVIKSKDGYQELSGFEPDTTNNRMELTACIKALEATKSKSQILLTTDSKYVVDGIDKGWARSWRANRWHKGDGKPALNPDLWDQLLTLIENRQVTMNWVKGHNGHPENERCDELAVKQYMGHT